MAGQPSDEERDTEFLPPEPPGPEPELGSRPAPQPPGPGIAQEPGSGTAAQEPASAAAPPPPAADEQSTWQQQPPPGWQQPPAYWQHPPGAAPPAGGPQHPPPATPPPAGAQPPPPATPPPAGAQPQHPGWQPAGWPPPQPPGWQPPPGLAPGWSYPTQPPEPGNGAAVAGFVTSVTGAALMLISFGFAAFISLICAPFGIYYSRKGKQAVDEGKTRKHRGLAQAGFVIGIVTLVISAIVTVLLIIFIIALATDESFRREFENDNDFDSTTARITLAAARLIAAVA